MPCVGRRTDGSREAGQSTSEGTGLENAIPRVATSKNCGGRTHASMATTMEKEDKVKSAKGETMEEVLDV